MRKEAQILIEETEGSPLESLKYSSAKQSVEDSRAVREQVFEDRMLARRERERLKEKAGVI